MISQSGDIPVRPKEIEQFIDQFLSTVCDTSRRHILEYLCTNDEHASAPVERSVGEIALHVELAASTTSEHLKDLLQLHLVSARKEGKKTYYRIRNYELVSVFEDMITALEDHYHRGLLPPPAEEEV